MHFWLLYSILAASGAQFFGSWKFRVANWNTGRLYAADNFAFGIMSFGPVCQGTGDERITGCNGQKLGNLVCKNIGFGNVRFIGLQSEYAEFMNGHAGYNETLYQQTKGCTPNYKIAGAKCKESSQAIGEVTRTACHYQTFLF